MARGNGRQAIFHAEDDYGRMNDGLAKTVSRTDWRVLAFVWMPNHIHLFVQTPKPNLSKGMQYLLSGYANFTPSVINELGIFFKNDLRRSWSKTKATFGH